MTPGHIGSADDFVAGPERDHADGRPVRPHKADGFGVLQKTEPVRVPSGVSIWAVIISMGRTSVLMRPMVASDVRPSLSTIRTSSPERNSPT